MKDDTVIFWGAFAIWIVALGFLRNAENLGLMLFTIPAIHIWARLYKRAA